MQGSTVRVAAAGFLAVVILSALGPSMAAAVEAAGDQPPPASRVKPIEPALPPTPPKVPPQAQPPHPTPKPKPKATPTPKPKPKPKPTPVRQSPGPGPGGQAPGDPKPVRSDEPPTAPVVPDPAADRPPAGPADAPSGGAADPPSGGAGSSPTGLALSVGPSPSRVHLVVAGATVSGIAAVAGWLVLGGRRRGRAVQRPPVRIPQRPGTTVTLADGMQLDLEVVVNRSDGPPQPRYSGRVPGTDATTLWTDDDDRPRWIRRFDEQGPSRPRAPRSSLAVEDREED